jgi:hypothetical protein
MRYALGIALMLAGLVPAMWITAQNQRLKFEVASIKKSPPGRTVDNGGLALRFTPGRLSATNVSLMELIAAAYRLPYWRIGGGPSWADPVEVLIIDSAEKPDVN